MHSVSCREFLVIQLTQQGSSSALTTAMHRVLSLPWRNMAPVPDGDATSFLIASLHYISLADVGYVCCLRRTCAATVPAPHWGTPFQILFAMMGLLAYAVARRLDSSVHRLPRTWQGCSVYL